MAERLNEYLAKISADLDRTVEFWLRSSHDKEYGGYFSCLTQKGEVYDDLKYGWLQCRQVYTYARLYNDVVRFHIPDILEAATLGARFIMAHLCDKTGDHWRCYFTVTRTGLPVKLQRKLFTECFYCMAMAEMARATGDNQYREEAVGMFGFLKYWVLENDSALGVPDMPGVTPSSALAIPMMIICVLLTFDDLDTDLVKRDYANITEWAAQRLLLHVQADGPVLEQVTDKGEKMPGAQGRLCSPGHAIEAGWFLLELAKRRGLEELRSIAINNFILNSFKQGWDDEHGGLMYFLDSGGYEPTQLTWNMKLWWPHNEALIAFLMAYMETEDSAFLDYFQKTFDYSYKHFVDEEEGEWYGYLSQQGDVNATFKGGPFKGFFHVPRCLLMCEKMLQKIISRQSDGE